MGAVCPSNMMGNPNFEGSFLPPLVPEPLYQNFSTQFPYDTAFFVGFKVFALRSESPRRSEHTTEGTESVLSALWFTSRNLGPPNTFLRHFRRFCETFVSHVNLVNYICQIMVIHTTTLGFVWIIKVMKYSVNFGSQILHMLLHS